ncbi:MAG: iron-containing alcohol dehydrogenase [Marinifilaceae bacterium]|jgi:NADP-dependent alcohol dehydrogenase|nr:iron-containing alcohol dehydrogenase [Marinifilaceae bacterium]
MKNFNFYNPVNVLFGEGKILEIKEQIPAGSKVMITYGGGSIKKNGVYDQICEALKDYDFVEFSGIEPNPRFETLIKAVELARKENVNFLLAVGGGSVLDGTKFISAAINFKGDEWQIVESAAKFDSAVPMGTVLTLPATGSEMNSGGVITKASTKQKLAFGSPLLFPRFSVLDPVTTYSLPIRQLRNGVVDAFVHVMEQYLTTDDNTPIQDRFAESILLTVMEEGSRLVELKEPDYQNRANFMWAATMALNGLISTGNTSDWATHMIGHELTAFYGTDHGVSLAIVLPGLLKKVKAERKVKLLQYASRVWAIDMNMEEDKIIDLAIEKTDDFFKSLGVETSLHANGISKDHLDEISERFIKQKYVGMMPDVKPSMVKEIFEDRF